MLHGVIFILTSYPVKIQASEVKVNVTNKGVNVAALATFEVDRTVQPSILD